jgi:fructosamine-3-kinase
MRSEEHCEAIEGMLTEDGARKNPVHGDLWLDGVVVLR